MMLSIPLRVFSLTHFLFFDVSVQYFCLLRKVGCLVLTELKEFFIHSGYKYFGHFLPDSGLPVCFLAIFQRIKVFNFDEVALT